MTRPAVRPGPPTGRGDTVYGLVLAALSVLLVVVGAGALLAAQRGVAEAREQLAAGLTTVARTDHTAPRDPRILATVQRRLPPYVSVSPLPGYPRTGRLVLRWHRDGRHGAVCLVVPPAPGQRLTSCRRGPLHRAA